MNIYVELNKVIEYIENHLQEQIEYKELSKMIGVNEYTFQRIFSLLSNVTVTEYIRNRRLSEAGQELYLKDKKVIDIAIKYGYNNPTAFSRAFEKFHGIRPSEVKNNPEKLQLYAKIHFKEITDVPSKKIEYKIVEQEQMILYGKCKVTDNKHVRIDAPSFHKEMQKQYKEAQYALVEYKDKERKYVKAYWILYDKENKGLTKKIIPESKWILIKVNSQEAEDIQNASKTFYNNFLPSSKYNFSDLPEIEYYHDGITDFLIPIED